ncbi:TPA: polysaccharide deacetylase family protein, partial [Shigella flexneri]|nr:polysaccharide deacetylase family protein [Shigella flexneri]
ASFEIWNIASNQNGGWTNSVWHRTYPASSGGIGSNRHSILEADQYASVGGVVYTDGATPVALTWDDFPAATRDLVVPMLEARGISATLCLPSRVLSPERAPYLGGEGITWPEINAWAASGTFEIANHSATHMDAPASGLVDEIETALAELKASLPDATIQCWTQPSVVYPDFNNGNSLDAWTRTEAGQMILDNHALATGTWNRNPDASVEMVGEPTQGVGRIWIDTASGLADIQSRIAGLAGTGRGVVVGAHANRMSMGGTYSTPAQIAAFLDWLVAEQNAGRVRLLTLSEWAWADARPTTNTGLLSAYIAARGA